MRTKTTLPISEARKRIFTIAKEIQKPEKYYTLTERGRPVAVILSAQEFELLVDKKTRNLIDTVCKSKKPSFVGGGIVNDGSKKQYGRRLSPPFKVFVVRDETDSLYALRDKKSPKDGEMTYIRSVLCAELVEKYKYPMDQIEIDVCVPTREYDDRKYIEVDIVVRDIRGNVRIIVKVVPFADYETKMDYAINDLFDLSEALKLNKKPKYLIYFSRAFRNKELQEKIATINYGKFSSFDVWEKAGKPTEHKIPAHM